MLNLQTKKELDKCKSVSVDLNKSTKYIYYISMCLRMYDPFHGEDARLGSNTHLD